MSTINVTTIQHESGSGNNIVLDSDGNVEIADGITAAGDGAFGGSALDNDEVFKISRATKGSPSNKIRFCVDDTEALKVANGDNAAAAFITYDGDITAAGKVISGDQPNTVTDGTGAAIFSDGSIYSRGGSSDSTFRIYEGTDSSPSVKIGSDGSAELGSGNISLDANGVITSAAANSNFLATASVATSGAKFRSIEGAAGASNKYHFYGDANGSNVVSIATDGSITGKNVSFNLDPDNPDSWKVTQEEYQENVTGPLGKIEKTVTKTREVREYVGPVLSVRDELEALRARATQQDAVIAQMVTALRSQGVTIDTTEVKE